MFGNDEEEEIEDSEMEGLLEDYKKLTDAKYDPELNAKTKKMVLDKWKSMTDRPKEFRISGCFNAVIFCIIIVLIIIALIVLGKIPV